MILNNHPHQTQLDSSTGRKLSSNTTRLLRVGLIGIGEVAQSVHLPTTALLSHLYTVTAICDISKEALKHCAAKFHIKSTYTSASELCSDPNVDMVFVLTSDELHETHAILALQNNKDVLIEKPISISLASARRIQEAETKSHGTVFVGYMRRYAPALETFLREVPTMNEIKFVRVRAIIGPNTAFVGQSGTFPLRFTDYPGEASVERTLAGDALLREVYPNHDEITPTMTRFCRFLGGLGSHDLSVMREVLGMPRACTGVSVHPPFFTATFEYDGFAVSYETGIDSVPRFDSHIQVYGSHKTVRLQYDTPYVKGLPILVSVDEVNEQGEFSQREIRPSYEDAYTVELKALHENLTKGTRIKTTVEDAMQDLEIFQLILKQAFPLDIISS